VIVSIVFCLLKCSVIFLNCALQIILLTYYSFHCCVVIGPWHLGEKIHNYSLHSDRLFVFV